MFEELFGLKRVSNKHWQQMLGKLQFVSTAIPGSAGLFSVLQLVHIKAKGNRVRVNRLVREHLQEFARLASGLCERPTYLAEITPEDPAYL